MRHTISFPCSLASLVLLLACLGQESQAAGEAARTASGTATEPAAIDPWYPRTVESEKGSMIIHAPQVDAWRDFDRLEGWSAFEIKRAGSDTSYFGSARFEAATDTDVAAREVLLYDFSIVEMTIKGLDTTSPEYELAEEAINAHSRKVPLDLVLEYLPQDMSLPEGGDLSSEPPAIFYSARPALLLSVDSEPVFVPVDKSAIRFLLNTNWDVLRVGDGGALYLCYEKTWLTATELSGPWSWAASLPAEFGSIPRDANWANVAACLPGNLAKVEPQRAESPVVFYSTVPAEMILTEGAPSWLAIGNTGLSYAANTAQELFRYGGEMYFLASGRWFRASALEGPWKIARELPEAFRQIPGEDSAAAHPKSYVRASVPGTREAWEAALIASIPRKAEIVRGSEGALGLDVTYAGGKPAFAPIEGTAIELAMNTSYQVLRYKGVYYLCHNAVWLTSSAAGGPWKYADSIPEAFAGIPPSSPAYNTTFVKVEDSDDEVVEYAYTSGYEGMYVEDETVVQGTGYVSTAMSITIAYGIYDGWWGYPYYPYYPWPPTYGYGSWYNPSTGRYGQTVVGYGPYGAAAGASVYNPETGVYGRGQAVWDSDEFAGRSFGYNPNTDTSFARNRYVDYDDGEGWSQGAARRGDEWRYRESEWEDGRMHTEGESSLGTQSDVYRERDGDTITSKGTIEGENRSATFESSWEDGRGSASVEGSDGGTGQLERQVEDGQITGTGEFTKDGQTIQSDVTRTAEGVKREFEGSEGGQGVSYRSGENSGFAYETGAGDMYAGRDGSVYKKTEDGWSSMNNPGSATQGIDRSQYDSSTSRLDRDYQSRQAGFERHSRYESGGGARRAAPRARRR